MLYLSQVLGRPIRDLEGERVATVKDVIVRLGADDHPPVIGDRAMRRVADGREFTIVKVQRDPAELAAALSAAGFRDVQATTTGRFFVLESCTA